MAESFRDNLTEAGLFRQTMPAVVGRAQPFIFVSYAREDCHFVYPEIERLRADGYTIWYDKEQIRASHLWSNEINEAMESCSCCLVFITRRSANSPLVIAEIKQALSLDKPLIAIYWQKIALPPDLRHDLLRIQGLEFYDLHRPSYESQLDRALSEFVGPRHHSEQEHYREPIRQPTSSHAAQGVSPKVIVFVLILAGTCSLFLGALMAIVPYFGSSVPGDPVANQTMGLTVGGLFVVVALGFYLAASIVYRKYLGSK
jgi:hypothetical protein